MQSPGLPSYKWRLLECLGDRLFEFNCYVFVFCMVGGL
jgi:hypothetical protein